MSLRRALRCAAWLASLAGLGACAEARTQAVHPVVVAGDPSSTNTIAVPRERGATDPRSPHELRRATPGEKRKQATIEGALGLYVGQPIAAAEQLVGGTVSHVGHDEEEAAWVNSGYTIDEEPIFVLGFDQVSEFSAPKLPVYKLYASRGLVRTIKFSAYVVDGASLERKVGFDPSCFLLGPPEGAVETFGPATYVEDMPDRSRVVFHFVDAGLSVLAEDGRVRVFDVFGSLTPTEDRRIRDALAKKSARTRS